MKRLVTLAVTALVVAAGVWIYLARGNGPEAGLGSVSAQEAASIDTSMIEEMAIGSPEAKVTVIEYASFTCPHCQRFHETSWAPLKANYIDTGKVRFIYREVYFDRFGLWAGLVARCGGSMRYFGIVDQIFQQQREWIGDGDPTQIADNLRRIGRTAGMSDEVLNACLNDKDRARAMVALYQQNATADGIEGTPTFLINGTKHSNMSYADFAAILDAELAKP